MREPAPESIQQSIDTVSRLARKCRGFITELQTGSAAKLVDSFYLPAGVAALVAIWCIGVLPRSRRAFGCT